MKLLHLVHLNVYRVRDHYGRCHVAIWDSNGKVFVPASDVLGTLGFLAPGVVAFVAPLELVTREMGLVQRCKVRAIDWHPMRQCVPAKGY